MDKEALLKEQMQAQRMMLEDALKELKDQNHELKRTLSKLRKRNNELAEVAYQTSHDLRGPVSTLQGLANLMAIENNPELINSFTEEIPKLLEKVDVFSRSLSDFTSIINAPIEYNLIEWIKIFKRISSNSNLENKTKIEIKEKNEFYSDSKRIESILEELLNNAYKYNRNSKELRIVVHVEVQEDFAEIKVEDNGVGLDKDITHKAFDMFYRGSMKSDGIGIGLYMVNSAIEDLNGQIELEDKPEKEGACFIIKIPQLNAPVELPSFDF